MTASLQVNKKDGKYYIHLNWMQNGKRKQKCIGTGLSASGNNKRRAERMRLEVLREWGQKIMENTTDILFSDYLDTWLTETRRTVAETTYSNYRSVINGVIRPYFKEKGIRLADLSARDIQAFYSLKMERDDISPNTIHHYQAYIHKALDYAVRMKMIRENPAKTVVLPRKEKHIAKALSAEDSRRLASAAMGTRLETVVMLALWFGLRRGEILGIRWKSFDFKNKSLLIEQVVAKAEKLIIKEPKTKASIRSFPLTDEMIAYFQKLQAKQHENRKRCGLRYNDEWLDFVCVDEFGNLLKPGYVTESFAKLIKKFGFEKVRLHELRHTNISLLLESGASMKELQEWAGHSSYSTTANIYAHVQVGRKTKLSQSIQGVLGS